MHLHWSSPIKIRHTILENISASKSPELEFIFWQLDLRYLGFVKTGRNCRSRTAARMVRLNVHVWAVAAEAFTPMILVYRVRIDGEAIRMVTKPGRLPQPLRRRLGSRRRTVYADQLGVLGVLIVRANVVQDVSGFHGGSLCTNPYVRYREQTWGGWTSDIGRLQNGCFSNATVQTECT